MIQRNSLRSMISPIRAWTSDRMNSSEASVRPSALIIRIGSVFEGLHRNHPSGYATRTPSTSENLRSEKDERTDFIISSRPPSKLIFASPVDGYSGTEERRSENLMPPFFGSDNLATSSISLALL